ncbi:transposase [Nitrosomonas communis]|uniref:transposase n=1 Tax=Nitrosomonas communis TaxID=44574 RepID=UPI000AB452AA|nr:transposase [Nitrosomonas communis]
MRHPKASEEDRCIFQQKIEGYEREGRVIVYLDESGFAHDMPRTHGCAPVGEHCHSVKSWHAGGRTHVIDALIGKALLTVGLFKAHINADIFHAWVTQELLPKLLPAYMIVMDHATFHPRQDIQTASANAGHTLEYLPSYSPDFNDIEPNGPRPKHSEKGKVAPSRSFCRLCIFNHFYEISYIGDSSKKKFCMASTIKLLPCAREFCAYAGR